MISRRKHFPSARTQLETLNADELLVLKSEPHAPPYLTLWIEQELQARRKIGIAAANTPEHRSRRKTV